MNLSYQKPVPDADVLEQRITNALSALLSATYPKYKFPKFRVQITHTDYKRIHGDYHSDTKLIRLTNMYREPRKIICCAIHEATHLCQDVFGNPLGHGSDFYRLYYSLMQEGIRMGFVAPEELLGGFEDEASLRKLLKTIGPLTAKPDPDRLYGKDKRLVVAYNAYSCKDELKKRGYRFNSRSKAWELEVPEDSASEEALYAKAIGASTTVTGLLDLTVLADIVVRGNTYPVKDKLSENKFRFNGEDKSWRKRVETTELASLKPFLAELECAGIFVSTTY